MKKRILFFLLPFLLPVFGEEDSSRGRFHSDGTVFYLVHPGGPLEIEIRLFKTGAGYRGNPVLKTSPSSVLTLSGPDGKNILRKYWKVRSGEKEKKYSFRTPDAAPGIWQIRNSFAPNCNMAIEFVTRPRLQYGVLFSRCRIPEEDLPNIRNACFLVPPPLPNLPQNPEYYASPRKKNTALHIAARGRQTEFSDRHGRPIAFRDIYEAVGAKPDLYGNAGFDLPFPSTELERETVGTGVLLFDSTGRRLLRLAPDNAAAVALENGEIYRLVLSGPLKGYLTLDGFPVILCPDSKTARALNGGILASSGSGFFAHPFQKRMSKWMKSLKKSDLEVAAVPITKYRKEWLADPRASVLLPLFSHAEHLLRSQEIDPEKENFGGSPLNLEELTLLYALDRPFNPYRGNPALMKRILLYHFRKWLYLTASGVMYDDPDQGAYCGGTEWTGWEGMALCGDYISAAMMAPLADAELTALWCEALALPVHRLWNSRLTCENQSLHWPLKIYALAMATKDPMYLEMARDLLRDFADPAMSRAMKTGYPMEAYGADATYAGISTALLAFAARFSGDDTGIPVLRRIYRFLNHTVVREPSGRLIGVNGFAHRTLGSWLERQYDGGAGLLADRLEEAAVVSRRTLPTAAEAEKAFEEYSRVSMPSDWKQWCAGPGKNLTRYALNPWLPFWHQAVLPVGKNLRNAKLPAEESEDFERDFNGEFHAKRTPAYYAFFYTGNDSWRRHNWRALETPFPEKAALVGGEIVSSQPSRSWMAMQGANLFWTPKFGAFLTARNWTMYTQNLVRVERDGKVIDFPTCFSAVADTGSGRIALEHSSRYLGLKMKRITLLEKNGMNISLCVTAPEKMGKCTLIEQIPFLVKPGLQFSCIEGGKEGKLPGKGVQAVRAFLPNGGAVKLAFSRPVDVRRGYNSRAVFNPPDLRIGLLEIVLSEDFDGSRPVAFTYQMKADDRR